MKRLLVVALAIVGILGAGCFVRFGTLYEQSDTSHFVAFATNLSKVDVVSATVEVDFYNSSNRLLDTEFVSPCTRTLQIGNDSPIDVVARSGIVADHVKTTVKPLTFGHKPIADLDVTHIVITKGSSTYEVNGNIDVGSKDLYSINVCAALLDKYGNVVQVGKVAASPKNIASDGSGTFDVSIPYDNTATKYELWIDAVTHSTSDVTAPVVIGPASIKLATPTPTPTKTKTPTPTATHTPAPPTPTPTATA
jgi:hypothetical protein